MTGGWNNNLLEGVWQNAGVGLMVQDRNRQIIAVNPSFERITGWPWKDIKGKRCDLVYGCHSASGKPITEHICPGARVINGEVTRVARELLICTNNGGDRWVEATVFPIKGDDGNIEYIISSFQDISEKKKYSEELLHTKTLATMGQLAAELAHEIKNPLNAIQIQMQLVEHEIAADKKLAQGDMPEIISKVKEEVSRLNDLVDTCLKFARPDNLVLKSQALEPVLQNLIKLVAAQADLNGINIEMTVEKDIPHVMVDSGKLKQALLNIVLNAFEAMPDGGTFTLTAAREGNQVRITARDTGCGIPEDEKENIFDLFYTSKINGTGIGLPTAHNIIQAHGGALSCNSSGRGAEFLISLPLADENR